MTLLLISSFLFSSETDADNIEFKLSGSLYGIYFNIPIDNPDACSQGLVKCPIKAGEKTTFVYKGNIESDVPSVSDQLSFNSQLF